jgi:hypothetical protein
MPWPTLTETQAQIVKGSLKGAVRGGAVGATASIASGAAVVITAPAWLPWIGYPCRAMVWRELPGQMT